MFHLGSSSSDVHIAYISDNGVLSTATGAFEVNSIIMNKLSGDKTCIGIQDDFAYWHSKGEADDSGKLLLIDTENLSNSDSDIHLFFDDNIELERSHIVDVRDVSTFLPLPFISTNKCILQRVESYLAIKEDTYFIDLLDKALENYCYSTKEISSRSRL